jgi:hypothetical protein
VRQSKNPERRRTHRRPVFVEGTISFAGRYRLKCVVQNISQTGAKLAFHKVTDAPAEFALNVFLAGKETQYLTRRRWPRHRLVGVSLCARL